MAALINLSKNWTYNRVFGVLRALSKTLTNDTLDNELLNDFVYAAMCSIAEILGSTAYNDYGEIEAATKTEIEAATANQFDIAGKNYDNIIKITDADNGLYKAVSLQEQENFHANIVQYAAKIVYTKFGSVIIFNPGANTYNAAVSIYYTRLPLKADIATAENLGDTLDISDKYVDLVINKAKISIYEMLQVAIPAGLANSVDNATERIKNSNMQELQAIKANEKS